MIFQEGGSDLSSLQLRNHIPLGAPARREPADGTESGMRVSLGFEPAWFHRRCGVDFSEPWHRDPLFRYQSLVKMQAEVCRAFPEVSDWKAGNLRDLATVSGCYGACLIPRVFGLPLRYAGDRWPELEPGQKLSLAEVERLDVDRLLAGPSAEELFTQMDAIHARWGRIHGYLNWQGVLNNAFHLRGQQVFLDLHDRPQLADHLFWIIRETMTRLARLVQERQRKSGFHVDHLCVSNCTMNLVSPKLYRRFIFLHDQRIAESFERFGVHTCNWNATPYLEVLQQLPKVGYLDMGMASDLPKARAMFPQARRAVLYSPGKLREATLEEIAADLAMVRRDLSPCDLVLADIPAGTPDTRVKDLLRICAELEA